MAPDYPESASAERPSLAAPPELSSAHDLEQLVCARGAMFLVTDRRGDVAPRGARELGLFDRDTRHLSYLSLRMVDLKLVHLSAETSHDAFNQVDMMVSWLDPGEFLDDPQNFLHLRRRQLLDHGLVEELTFTNFLNRAVSFVLEIEFDADFADIFEVRGAKRAQRGSCEPPRVGADSVCFSYIGLDAVHYTTTLCFAPAPQRLSGSKASFTLKLEAGGTRQIGLTVVPSRGSAQRARAILPFGQRVDALLEETRRFRDESTRVRCDNQLVQRALEQAVADLFSLRLEVGSARIVTAGIPWFCCPFGRDALLASYESLVLNPELAAESLRVLAAFQGTRERDETEEEPGKIFHELRFGEMANTGEMPHSPYYGTIDATPLFVIVADATYRVTGDLTLLRDLRGALLAALAFIDARSACAERFVSYERRSARGLDNQGWKDSRAGVSFPDGRRASPPIALCEIQGYCVDAYTRGARMLEVLGERELAATYAERAARLRALTELHFWLPDKGRYAFAIDGRGEKLDTIVSNLGHLLWSRVPSGERALATSDLLLSPASFSGFGVRTLAADQAIYNPLSYHNGTVWPHDNAIIAKGMANYGQTGYVATIFDALIEALRYFRDRRLPELFCGMPRRSGNLVRYPVACSPQAWASAAPFLLLQSVLGLHLDAPGRRLSIRNANLPASVDWFELEGLRIGHTRVSLRLRRAGKGVHLERLDVTGPPIRTEIEID
jgi:glycogen debranching enzyme